ncbi:type II toxin-antitoxin system VapC family toxin [Haloarcula nitratireducens]|uniref:type II toxin-antitoxin system VapC family toxin n=1 Tax=Haloarcula nitratireducens TaxID=2487749 RepID=UPI002E2E0C62|nr:type II toxin-antitoxin system VapC family toxin [Halomicroarcula nitratireducens]
MISFDEDTAEEAANIESALRSAGTSLKVGDLLIAATARQHGATLVTADKKDFDKQPIHQLLDIDVLDTE